MSATPRILDDSMGGSYGAFGVVLVARWDSEYAYYCVTDELLHDAAIDLYVLSRHREVGREHVTHVFGISRLGRCCEAHQVAEEDGDYLALLHDDLTCVRHRCAAVAAKVAALRVLVTA